MNNMPGTEKGLRPCYYNNHLSPNESAIYDLCKRLAHSNNGILTLSCKSISDLYRSGTSSASKTRRYITILAKLGWFELVHGKEYTGHEKSTPNHYRVLDHAEWVKLHPGDCYADLLKPTPSVAKPIPSLVNHASSLVEPTPPLVDAPPSSVEPRPSPIEPSPSPMEPQGFTSDAYSTPLNTGVNTSTNTLPITPTNSLSNTASSTEEERKPSLVLISVSSTKPQEDFKDGNEDNATGKKEASNIERVEASLKQEVKQPSIAAPKLKCPPRGCDLALGGNGYYQSGSRRVFRDEEGIAMIEATAATAKAAGLVWNDRIDEYTDLITGRTVYWSQAQRHFAA
jgi:hypothetical protein